MFDVAMLLTRLFCVTLLSSGGTGQTAQSSDRVSKGEPTHPDPTQVAL
jgi:hypothetical protein